MAGPDYHKCKQAVLEEELCVEKNEVCTAIKIKELQQYVYIIT
jgi:hypothetical protein